jgi:hypothetical protein
MLDEKTDNLNSENLTENSTSKPEIDKSELTDSTDEIGRSEDQKAENSLASDGDKKNQESLKKDSVKKAVKVRISDKEEIEDENLKDKKVSKDKVLDKVEDTIVDKENSVEVDDDVTPDKKVVHKKESEDDKILDKEEDGIVDKEDSVEVDDDVTSDTKVVDKKDSKDDKIIEKIDFERLDLEQLVKEFEKLLVQDSIPAIKGKIEKIKQCFNLKYGELLKQNKEVFIADGGNEIDFHYSNPIKSVYNDLLFEFKTKRQHYYKRIEEEQKNNLEKKLLLIDELKDLIDNAESSTMYQNFKALQQKWNTIGNIPRTKYNDTWRTYHHHVERFYDLLHLSNDLRDLDFKHNYEEKLKLVEKAEELAISSDLGKAFKELQVLHKLWKEDIGPVGREHREEIWERFSNATKKIHDKRHDLQKSLESKYEDNVGKKREVINKIANLVSEKIDSHKVWQQKIKELETLRQEFFKIGAVPRAENDKIWKEFKEATRNFNRIKNVFYKEIKKGQQDNLNKKNALVERAESLKESEDWDTTTDLMKQIQAEWKTIGHVPRKYSDKIWKQFKDACNYYFDRLHGVQDEANKDQVAGINKKKELLENLKSQSEANDVLTLEVLNTYVEDWHKLGRLPNNMHHIEIKFNKTLNSLYSKLDLDEKEIALLKFKNIVNNYLSHKNFRKLDGEQLFVRKKIDELTREIQQLETNISFISNADDDNPILKNVHQNIDNYNSQLEIWKTKLDYLSKIEY